MHFSENATRIDLGRLMFLIEEEFLKCQTGISKKKVLKDEEEDGICHMFILNRAYLYK